MNRKTYLDRYRIISDARGALAELRRHGPAVTYQAEDSKTGEEVAVEVILAFGLAENLRDELEAEAKAAKQLQHPNLPALLEYKAETDQFVFVWEHFDGTTAEAWVRERGPMPVGPVLRIALQVVSTLGAATFHGIVHGAINPRNILLVPGQTATGDWPLIKILQLVGPAPTFGGPRFADAAPDFAEQFASPEQLKDGTVDFRAEIYSLGATLWFLLSGAAPVAGEALPHIGGLPRQVEQLLEQMLAQDPEERPQDPVAFEEYLRACLEKVERREAVGRRFGLPVAAAASPSPVAARRRLPWRPLALAALIFLLATLGAFLLPTNLRPARWLADNKTEEAIGVPVGVPEPVASAVASSPNERTATAAEPEPAPELPTTPAVVAESAPVIPERVAPTEPVATPSQVTAEVRGEAVAALSPIEASTAGDIALAEAEPPAPAEGPEETSPPAYATAREPEPAERELEEEVEPAEPVRAPARVAQETPAAAETARRVEKINGLPVRRAEPVLDEPPAPAPATRRVTAVSKRARRINGLEVRPAEPVYEGAPGLPPRAKRARYLGTTPEGELVFEGPSAERGYIDPRR